MGVISQIRDRIKDEFNIVRQEILGAWVTSHTYKVGYRVVYKNNVYLCITQHTSGTFLSDYLTSGYWVPVNIPVGIISPVLSDAILPGFKELNGQSISRTDFDVAYELLCPTYTGVTISIATPGEITLNSHGFSTGWNVVFSTDGTLPTGITAGTVYWVIADSMTANTFRISATKGGSAIDTSGTQSGTHSMRLYRFGAGDGSTTFSLVDARGGFLRAAGTSGLTDYTMANGTAYTGGSVGQMTLDRFQSFWMDLKAPNGNSMAFDADSTSGSAYTFNGTGPNPNPINNSARSFSSDGVNGTPRPYSETSPFSVSAKYQMKV